VNEIELLFVEPMGWSHHGLPVVKVDGVEYAVAETDEEADRAAKEAAKESLWAFRTGFLARYVGLNESQEKAIRAMQDKLCEDAQPIIEKLLGDQLDECLEDAIATDGRGHALSPYDGDEHDGEDIHPALTGKIVYRL